MAVLEYGAIIQIKANGNFIKRNDTGKWLIIVVQQGTGAEHFREKNLLMEVIADQAAKASEPRSFLYGPYLRVEGVGQRICSTDEIGKDEGATVYCGQEKAIIVLRLPM